MEIGYVTEDPARAYTKGLSAARTHEALLEHVREYRECADDAVAHVARMTQEDFEEFKRALPRMRKAEGDEAQKLVEKWGDIVMPEKMMTASLVAAQYHAPWGLAFMRCEESGWSILKQKAL